MFGFLPLPKCNSRPFRTFSAFAGITNLIGHSIHKETGPRTPAFGARCPYHHFFLTFLVFHHAGAITVLPETCPCTQISSPFLRRPCGYICLCRVRSSFLDIGHAAFRQHVPLVHGKEGGEGKERGEEREERRGEERRGERETSAEVVEKQQQQHTARGNVLIYTWCYR